MKNILIKLTNFFLSTTDLNRPTVQAFWFGVTLFIGEIVFFILIALNIIKVE